MYPRGERDGERKGWRDKGRVTVSIDDGNTDHNNENYDVNVNNKITVIFLFGMVKLNNDKMIPKR
jgi:hypothetical protein